MGTVYAIANQKGGVGKTTTAVNWPPVSPRPAMSCCWSTSIRSPTRQSGWGIDKRVTQTVYDVLMGERLLADVGLATGIEHLGLVPAGPDLAGANVELPRLPGSRTGCARR